MAKGHKTQRGTEAKQFQATAVAAPLPLLLLLLPLLPLLLLLRRRRVIDVHLVAVAFKQKNA